nr:C-type lectin 37Db-like [Drosophila takahashii]
MKKDLTTKLQSMLDQQAEKLNQLVSEQSARSSDNARETLAEELWNFECSKPPRTTKWCAQIGEKHYFIDYLRTATWSEADGICRQMGGHLASLQSNQEWQALEGIVSHSRFFWLDINDVASKGKYVSETTGENATFLKWDHNEPNNWNGNENCVHLKAVTFLMNDVSCSSTYNFICER